MAADNSIIFIHAPKKCAETDGTQIREIMALPAGLFALASMCEAAGWESGIIHLGIEEILHPGFNIADALNFSGLRIAAFSLQWHQQLAEVAKAAKTIKSRRPDTLVIAGGITATYFAQQIMQTFPCFDAIISGDAETPLLNLLEHIEKKGDSDFTGIPNITWRKQGQIIKNPNSYACDKKTLDNLDYAGISLLRNSKHYTGAIEHPRRGNISGALWGTPKIAHVVTGRGCTRKCSYCSGSAINQKKTFSRSGILLRAPDKVSEEIQKLIAQGFGSLYFSFAPPGTDEYYFRLFEILDSKNIAPQAAALEYFGGLPPPDFFSRFSRICDDATVVISPASAVRAIRLSHKLPDFSNDEMEETISIAAAHNVKMEIYFSLLPNDTSKSLEKTMEWAARLQRYFKARCKIVPIEIEPGSDWFEQPGRYGLTLLRKNLTDFVAYHGGDRPFGLSEKLGYTIADEKNKVSILGQFSAQLNRC